MSGWKDQSVYDNTDADTLDASDTIGAVVKSSDGTEITHTTIGGVEALDVNIAGPVALNVDLNGIYNVSTNATPDSAGSIFHTRAATLDETVQVERTTAASPASDNIDPANVNALDTNSFIHAWDGSAWDRLTSSANGLNVDIGASVALDVNVQDGAGTDITSTLVGSDQGLDVNIINDADFNVKDIVDTAIANGTTTVGTTAVSSVTSPLAARKLLFIKNNSNKKMYVGTTGVTTANGFPLGRNTTIEVKAGPNINPLLIGTAAGQDSRYLEFS